MVVLLGLGKVGILKFEERPDCLDAERVIAVPGEADVDSAVADNCESDGCDGRQCS